jgi:hypothetical protein
VTVVAVPPAGWVFGVGAGGAPPTVGEVPSAVARVETSFINVVASLGVTPPDDSPLSIVASRAPRSDPTADELAPLSASDMVFSSWFKMPLPTPWLIVWSAMPACTSLSSVPAAALAVIGVVVVVVVVVVVLGAVVVDERVTCPLCPRAAAGLFVAAHAPTAPTTARASTPATA